MGLCMKEVAHMIKRALSRSHGTSLATVLALSSFAVSCGTAVDDSTDAPSTTAVATVSSEADEPAPATPEAPTPNTSSTTTTPSSLLDRAAADPGLIRIPEIGVSAPVIPLGLRDDGSIEVPVDVDDTGWWRDGPEPGERGPSVILGHVDSYEGPGVFADLSTLEIGALIHVDRVDGSSVSYRVTRAEQHDKESFPTKDVYGDTEESVLRLVTCGGEFDTSERSYLANYIVFAELVPGSDTRDSSSNR